MSDLSVLLPVHNASFTLGAAIRSLQVQTRQPDQVVAVDDGSTDGSRDILRAWAAEDTRVTLVELDRQQGVAGALNEGLQRCSSDLVARMDADDVSLPDRFAEQRAALLEDEGTAMVSCWVDFAFGAELDPDVRRSYENVEVFRRALGPSRKEIRENLRRQNLFHHGETMFRRSLVECVGGYRPEFVGAEDYDLWLRLSRKHRLAIIPKVLYQRTIDGRGVSQGASELPRISAAQARVCDELGDSGIDWLPSVRAALATYLGTTGGSPASRQEEGSGVSRRLHR